MMIFDGHNDTLTKLFAPEAGERYSFFEENTAGHIDLPRAKRGGLAGGLFAIFAPPPPDSPERDMLYNVTFTENGYITAERSVIEQQYAAAFTGALLDYAYLLEANSNGEVRIVTGYDALERSLHQDGLTMVLHLEGAEAILPDLSNLDHYCRRGVRSIGPVWSRPNAFGYGVPFIFPHSPDTGPGLTDAGKALVRACNRLGILLDLAHLNLRGFFDVAAITNAPLVVTHADVYSICPSTRNLTDEQIDAVGQTGGVIGINFETGNTHPTSSFDSDVPLTQIIRHIDTIAERIGVEHVAFGSDFDGADMPASLKDTAGLPALIDALLSDGYTAHEVEQIAYKNWLRVLKATWKV
jgi:membrane dipeptidase